MKQGRHAPNTVNSYWPANQEISAYLVALIRHSLMNITAPERHTSDNRILKTTLYKWIHELELYSLANRNVMPVVDDFVTPEESAPLAKFGEGFSGSRLPGRGQARI